MHRRSVLATAPIVVASTACTATIAARDDDSGHEAVPGENDVDLGTEIEEDDDHVEYLGDDEVRFVEGWRAADPDDGDEEPPEREPVYTTTDWEEWGRLRTRPAAAEVAADHLVDELGIDDDRVGSGISSRVTGVDSAAVVTVLAEGGGPGIDEIAAVTPATVDVTYVLDGREFEHEEAVFVRLRAVEEGTVDDESDSEEGSEADGDDAPEQPQDGDDPAGTDSSDDSTQPGEDDDSVPGFGPVAAVGGILTALVARRLRGESGG